MSHADYCRCSTCRGIAVKPMPVHADHTAIYVAETEETIRKLRAEVAELRDEAKKARDAFLWAEQKREKARVEAEAKLRSERDAAREALREACDCLAHEYEMRPARTGEAQQRMRTSVDELRKRGGIGG